MAHSDENDTDCIGLVAGKVEAFPPHLADQENHALKIPHMGWNKIHLCGTAHPVLADVRPDDEFYFVHSYYPQPDHPDQVLAVTEYGMSFPSVIGFNNLVATQFHPEKSGEAGLNLLRNFCKWSGQC
jgi:glutamine amidotransferase